MAKLTDKQKKKMIAMYAECQNYSLVAREFGVSETTARRQIKGDAKTAEKVERKKAENTASILAHMTNQKGKVCSLLDRLIEAMDDPEKMKNSTLPQIATALGILVDKYTMDESKTGGIPQDNNLFEVIQQSTGEEIDTSEISEIEPEAAASNDMVEPSEV